MKRRFRYCYGETHDASMVADDVKREYIHSGLTLVDMMNEYEIKNNLMRNKLEELGFKLIFLLEEYDMEDKRFKRSYTENPNFHDNGEWLIVSEEEFDSFKWKER